MDIANDPPIHDGSEASIRLLDAVYIDDGRQFIEFRFQEIGGGLQRVQIDFEYLESLAAVFQQAFISASLDAQQGGNKALGREWLSVPRADIDHPVSVGHDIMTNRIVAMFLLGSPFQVCYSLPKDTARGLAVDLLAACDQVDDAGRRRAN